MRLRINGEHREVESVDTLGDLIRHYQLDRRIIVVEHNRSIIPKEQYESVHLSDDDHVEIVHFVGGG